ncbi:MAG TPA: hypothetical protein VF026_00175 [Ktedonobacteraceae bacterium]
MTIWLGQGLTVQAAAGQTATVQIAFVAAQQSVKVPETVMKVG